MLSNLQYITNLTKDYLAQIIQLKLESGDLIWEESSSFVNSLAATELMVEARLLGCIRRGRVTPFELDTAEDILRCAAKCYETILISTRKRNA